MCTPSIKRSFLYVGIAVLFSAAIYPSASAQTPDPVPFARLLPSTPSTRPRRATPTPVVPVATDNETLPTTTTANVASPGLDEANPVERRAFEQTNLERAKNGLPPFAWDPALCRMARHHSESMAKHGFFSHVSPDGSRLRDRAKAVGIMRFTVVGENIAYNLGYDDPGAFAVERWMLSPGHRANILYAGFQAMAVGTSVGSDGAVYLTQTFITR